MLNATPSSHHLAELNIGRLVAPATSPIVAEFVEAVDRVNGIAKRSEGFVWMMEGAGEPNEGNLSNYLYGDENFVSNFSIWENFETLERFVLKTVHRQFLARRKEWFEVIQAPSLVLWNVEKGATPGIEDALEKLEYYRAHGDSEHAFGWQYAQKLYSKDSQANEKEGAV